MSHPVLFCFDGSDGSRSALRAASQLVAHPAEAVVLTVWTPAVVALARAGSFMTALPDETNFDEHEQARAQEIAEDGAKSGRDHGYDASPRTAEAKEGVAHAVLEVADEIVARLIVCGQRGRGPVRAALLGSVSHALSSHARRPILISPEG